MNITVESVQEILDNIRTRQFWGWKAYPLGERVYIKGTFQTVDSHNPWLNWEFQTREWLIQEDADEGGVVRTVWLAILVATEHEEREWFSYKGNRVMYPHTFDPEATK